VDTGIRIVKLWPSPDVQFSARHSKYVATNAIYLSIIPAKFLLIGGRKRKARIQVFYQSRRSRKMSKIIILSGKKGSGKTTWARDQAGYSILSKDAIKNDLFSNGYKNNLQNQQVVNNHFYNRLRLLIEGKKNIIIDKCNLSNEAVEDIKRHLPSEYIIEVKKIYVPFLLRCWRRCKRWANKRVNIKINYQTRKGEGQNYFK
jgi:predicted kinase